MPGYFIKIMTRNKRLPWLAAVLSPIFPAAVFATAGGAGGGGGNGGSSGSGDGEAIFDILFFIIRDVPFPYNLLVIAVIVYVFWHFGGEVRSSSGLNRIPAYSKPRPENFTLPNAFLQSNPSFNQALFIGKVRTAYMAIQQAWMIQDLNLVRRWISDGVWQRFNTQFAIMRALGQRNTMSEIVIKKIFIDSVQQDGPYDIIDVGIHFSLNDNFITDRFPQLNREGPLETLEYWTFMRKSGVAEKDLYHSNACPACGSPLPQDMGETARCAHCGTVSTLGDYDWILSEITQADDYANESAKLDKSGKLTRRIRDALGKDADFSAQLIEDKASNAYMQIMGAMVARQPEKMRRFVGDELFGQLTQTIGEQAPFVFNRLYLNNVTLMDYFRQEGKDHLAVAFKYTAQRVDISDGSLRLIDHGLYSNNEIMILSRDIGADLAKGSLYAHSCPACGAPVADTLDVKCAYCGAVLNSTQHEWIVTRLLKPAEYKTLTGARDVALTTGVDPVDLDPLFKVRDYAFNNLMMIIGIDGEITQQEKQFAYRLSRKLGYDEQKIIAMYDLARNRRLVLRLPEDRKDADKVLKLMTKAAAADGQMSSEEATLLEEVRDRVAKM